MVVRLLLQGVRKHSVAVQKRSSINCSLYTHTQHRSIARYVCVFSHMHIHINTYTHHTNTHIPGVNIAIVEDVLEFAATELAALDKPARQIGVGAQEVMDL